MRVLARARVVLRDRRQRIPGAPSEPARGFVTGKVVAELMMTVGQRDEVLVRHVRWIERRKDAGAAGRSHRPWWQTGMLVRVVRGLDLEMLVEHSILVLTERILHRWIRLKQHVVAQPIHVH